MARNINEKNENISLENKFQESDEAARYMTFYPITEWPHVSIVDPRTGENMVTWSRYVSDPGKFTLTNSDAISFESLH